jgi:phosphoglycolate phosphatase
MRTLDGASLDGVTIAFDLDGTLIDTAPDLLLALNKVLAREGLAPAPQTQFRALVGQGARALIERGAALSGAVFTADKLDALTDDFIRFYRADIATLSRPFPGLEAALAAIAGDGARLCVCTNKRTDLAIEVLDALHLSARFAAIIGADLAPQRKPHPDHFREAIRQAGGSLDRAIMVGDSSADVQSAKAAGAPVLIARFGYADAPVESLGANAVFDHYEELGRLIRQLLAD